ncbi:hypothetical protein ACFLYH_02700 [Candidatus Dependentiae bacterium]
MMRKILFLIQLFLFSSLYSKRIIIDLETVLLKSCFSKTIEKVICDNVANLKKMYKKYGYEIYPEALKKDFNKKFDFVKNLFLQHNESMIGFFRGRLNCSNLYEECFNSYEGDITIISGENNKSFNILDKEMLLATINVLFGPTLGWKYFEDDLWFANCFECNSEVVTSLEQIKLEKKHTLYLISNYPKKWLDKIIPKFNLYRFFKEDENIYYASKNHFLKSENDFWQFFFNDQMTILKDINVYDYVVITGDYKTSKVFNSSKKKFNNKLKNKTVK